MDAFKNPRRRAHASLLKRPAFAHENEPSYTKHLEESSQHELKDYEVWVPLQDVFVEQDFAIGLVQCRTMGPASFTEHLDAELSRAEDTATQDALRIHFEQLRKRHQGHAAVVGSVRAEQQRAYEIVAQRAQQACDVLRLYDPAIFQPEQAVILLDWSNIDPSIFGTLVRGSRKWPRPHRDPRDVHDGC